MVIFMHLQLTFSYGTINIYDQNNNFVKSFNTSITQERLFLTQEIHLFLLMKLIQ